MPSREDRSLADAAALARPRDHEEDGEGHVPVALVDQPTDVRVLLDLTPEGSTLPGVVHVESPTVIELPDGTNEELTEPARFHISAQAGIGLEVVRIPDAWSFRVAPREETPEHPDGPVGVRDRPSLVRTLRRALARSERTGAHVATFVLGIDGFASVGEKLGRETAAAVVAGAAERLQAACRPSDVIAYVGGSRFAVMCEDVAGPRDAGSIAHRIARSLETALVVGPYDVELSLDSSIGISLDQGRELDPESIIERAHIAQSRAAREGTRFEVFDEAANQDAIRRLQLEAEFSRGLPAGQLALYYQPILDLHSGEVNAAEALVRWDHPEHGLLRPADFLDIADQIDLVAQLARWTLRSALSQLAEWDLTTHRKKDIALHVNVSPSQLMDQRVLRAVRTALQDYSIAPSRLVLEITESAFIEN